MNNLIIFDINKLCYFLLGCIIIYIYFFRYLSLIDTPCGFDEKFFAMFKLTLQTKKEKEKHGVILLDEIHLRESINVNSKRLTYIGLVDFGIDGLQSTNFDEKADHGLVIMFQSIADSYSQPIGVFASRGPVLGETIAQLVIKVCFVFSMQSDSFL